MIVPLVFTDVYGNPLPPTVRVNVFPVQAGPNTTPAASAFLGVTSSIDVDLTVGQTYRVQYVDRAAPKPPSLFTLASSAGATIIPSGYVSPWANAVGYAQQTAELIPEGRVTRSELAPGGGVYVLLSTMAALMGRLDLFGRTNAAGERFESGNDAQADSYAQDFLGNTCPRLPGELTAAFIARVEAWFQTPFGTIRAIQTSVASYYDTYSANEVGYGVFDRRTDPVRSARYGLLPGQVAIIAYYQFSTNSSWVLGQSRLGQNTELLDPYAFSSSTTAVDPNLAARVNRVALAGIQLVYISSAGEPH